MNHRQRITALMFATLFVALAAPGAQADVAGRRAHTAKPHGAKRVAARRALRPAPHSPSFRKGSAEWTLVSDLEKVWKTRTLRPGKTAVYIKDARTGAVLYSVHADRKLNPASNVKLLATAATLATLGPDWRYTTRLYGPTPDRNGVVRGSIYLYGHFDPTLNYHHLYDIAGILAANGVTRVEGDVIVGTGARRDGVSLPYVRIEVTGAARVGDAPTVTVTPPSDLVQVEVAATTATTRRARLRLRTHFVRDEVAGSRLMVKVAGSLRPHARRTYRRWVPARALFTGHTLRAALETAGVAVTGDVRRQPFDDYVTAANHQRYLPVELARHESARMADIITLINKRSINYLADGVLMTAGAHKFGGDPTMSKGLKVVYEWLSLRARISPDEVLLDTGSGLSYRTQLSAKNIVRVLRVALGYKARGAKGLAVAPHASQLDAVFRHSLAVAGVDGTLRRRFKRSLVRGSMIGKTGTLTGIIALSGIVSAGDDNALAFSIVTNGTPHWRRGRVRRQHERMVNAMHRYLRTRNHTTAAGHRTAAIR